MKSLNVYWGAELVGHLAKTGSRDMSFRYADSYLVLENAQPISLSLPIREGPFNEPICRAWFANLLPEGEIRWQVARKLGVSERNDFDILEGIGGECAGALRIVPESETRVPDSELVPLPWNKLETAIASRPRSPLLALMLQDIELRLSLAGAQNKLPVHYAAGKLSLPRGSAASTHLLKVGSEDFPDLVQNEFYCLTLARRAGLPVPPTELADTETPILLVERYDRRPGPDGTITRLHQEDFCQALGVPPESKYETEGGPSLENMFEVLARGSRSPLPDKRDLIRWIIFNFIIGNADSHAKNVSFLLGAIGENSAPRLAPFYDLVCTRIYGGLSSKMAQKIGGEYRPGFLARRHWERFANIIGVNFNYLSTVGLELCATVEKLAGPLAGDLGDSLGGEEILEKIAEVIGKRTDRLKTAFNQSGQ